MTSLLFLSNLLEPVPSHLLSEALFALFLYLIQLCRYLILLKNKFDGATFLIYYKGNPTHVVRKATCRVKWGIKDVPLLNPVITYEGEQIDSRQEGEFSGQFIIDPLTLRKGEGEHFHKTYEGFNFPQIVIKDKDTLFVETTYLRPKSGVGYEFEEMHQSYVWRRDNSSRKDTSQNR
jgi:hypothetical protein